jgi:2-oxoglutarate ferredoxin oxidoreductase subunit delta
MKGKIAIDRDLCKGCKYCVLSCLKGVIVMDSEFNASGYFPARVGDIEKCNGCALCAQMCPEIAITVWGDEDRKEEALVSSAKT